MYLHLVKVFYQSGVGVRIPGETDAAEQLVVLAKVLLAENKLSITEIAFACGFHSTAAFNRQFLKMTGMTPTEMQKRV